MGELRRRARRVVNNNNKNSSSQADLSVACDLEVDAFSSYHFSNAWDEGEGAQQRLHVHVARHIGARTPIERHFADMYSANWKVSAPCQ